MTTFRRTIRALLTLPLLLLTVAALAPSASAQTGPDDHPVHDAAVIAHWTPQRIASAQPRDLVMDQRGLAYLRAADGALLPYQHSTPYRLTQERTGSAIMAKPPSGGDTTAPSITNRSPADGATVGTSVSFRATITDASGLRSVDVVVIYPGGRSQTFSAADFGNNVYGADLSGFTDGAWGWYVTATDNAGRGGNTATTPTWALTVDTNTGGGGGGGGTGGNVANAHWTSGGQIQLAAGRILFEMPTYQGKRVTWNAYVCSGTTVVDSNTGASVIVTAAHCVYDDANKEFARNVLFIPSQDDGGTDGTDTNCANDPIGCFTPSHGVVDANWTTRTFPDNVEWDYAYYVVPTNGLENAVDEQAIDFSFNGATDPITYALGYSYSDDPFFMYCAEPIAMASAVNWWLGSCGLSGGASGGPWIHPMDTATGSGPIVSVNSWGYTTQPGMAGPLLDSSADCVFAQANNENAVVTNRGVIVSGCQ